MKKHLSFIAAIISITAATSCSNDERGMIVEDNTKVMHILPSVAMDMQSRVSSPSENSFVFDNNDAIGISIANEKATLTGTERNFNTKFTKTNSAWQQATHTYWLTDSIGTRNDIIGYYPYIATIQEPAKVPLDFVHEQNEISRLTQCDFLWGRNTVTKSGTNSSVPLQMKHIMTKLTFNVKIINGYEDCDGIKNLRILSRTNISLNLSTGHIAATGNLTPVTPHEKEQAAENCMQTYEAILPPQNYAGETFITFTVAGKSYSQSFTHSMLSGKHYTFLLSLAEDKAPTLLLVSSVNIDNWKTGETDNETIITSPRYKVGDLWPNAESPIAIILSERVDNKRPGIMMTIKKTNTCLVNTRKYDADLKNIFISKSGKSNMRNLKAYIEKNNLPWSDFPAVKMCADLGDEWFIPAVDELTEAIINFSNYTSQETWFNYIGASGQETMILTLSFDETFTYYFVGCYMTAIGQGTATGGIYSNITSYAQMRAIRYY